MFLQLAGLWNAELSMSEKGFYLMAFTMSLFASITVQKNVRDMQDFSMDKISYDSGTPVPNSEERHNILQSPFRRNKD